MARRTIAGLPRSGYFTLLSASLGALILCLLTSSAGAAQESDAIVRLRSAFAALNGKNISPMVTLFAPEGEIRVLPANTQVKGTDAIRSFFQRQVDLNGNWDISNYQANGDRVTFHKSYQNDSTPASVGRVEYAVDVTMRDGQIQSFVMTTAPESMAKLQAATNQAPAATSQSSLPKTGGPPLPLILVAATGLVVVGAGLRHVRR